MDTRLNFWATFIFGPLYLGWKGFLKEGLFHFLIGIPLSFFFIDIILFGHSELISIFATYVLMFTINYCVFRFWPRYTSKYKIKIYNRIVSFIFIFFIYNAVGFYFAINELALEMGMDKSTFMRELIKSLNGPNITGESLKKMMEAFGNVSGG